MRRGSDRFPPAAPDLGGEIPTRPRIGLGQLSHSARHGRSARGGVCEPGKALAHREAAVEPTAGLGAVSGQVPGAGAVIRARQRAPDAARDRADPGGRPIPGDRRSTSGHERPGESARVFRGTKEAKGVGQHDGARLEVAPGPGGDVVAAKRADPARTHSRRPALTIAFDRGAERRPPRLPPRCSPPRYASSICTEPPRGRVSARSFITCTSLCPTFQRALSLTDRCRDSSGADMPFFACVIRCIARNQVRSGSFVLARIGPVVSEPDAGGRGTGTGRGPARDGAPPASILGRQTPPAPAKQRSPALRPGPILVHEPRHTAAIPKPIRCRAWSGSRAFNDFGPCEPQWPNR